MKYACKIIDEDCGTGKTFNALSRCFSLLKNNNIVYAARTKELANDIFKKAIYIHNIPEEKSILCVGEKSVNQIKHILKNKTHKFIVTTHDALNYLNYVKKSDYILFHDEKPSDNNLISVYQHYSDFLIRYPLLKNFISEFSFDTTFRSEKFQKIKEKYKQIGIVDKKLAFRFYRNICKNQQDNIDRSLIFFLADLFRNNFEYYINKKRQVVRLLNWEPYNNWKDVIFMMAHSGIDSEHYLPFIQKCKLYDIQYTYSGSPKKKLSYKFNNLKIYTTNTYKRWSKNYYNKNNNLENILTQIKQNIQEDDKLLVLCNKGYEKIVREHLGEIELLDHAPYGKEKTDYLKCNVIINLAAKNKKIIDSRLLNDFGFHEKIDSWNKADDIIQYLMRSKIRENKDEHVKLFITDTRIAELVSIIVGIPSSPFIKIEKNNEIEIKETVIDNKTFDEKYYITIFKNVRDTFGESYQYKNFDEIIDILPKDTHKRSGCFMFSENTNGRKFENIIKISALTFDFDNQSKRPLTETNIIKQIKSHFGDIVFYVQRTFSQYNFRVIIPLEKNISPEYYQRIMKFISSRLSNLDDSCCKPTQIYFASKFEIKKYGDKILNVENLHIPKKVEKIRRIINNKNTPIDLNKAHYYISNIPEYNGSVKTNSFCVNICKKVKKMIGKNNIVTHDLWLHVFYKLESYLKHEGENRINDFIRYSYK